MADQNQSQQTQPNSGAAASADAATKIDGIVTDIKALSGGLVGAMGKVATASTWTAIVGFFTALPGIITLIEGFMAWVNAVSGNNPQKFMSDVGQGFSQLAAAKTAEDRDAATQSISKLFSRLPS